MGRFFVLILWIFLVAAPLARGEVKQPASLFDPERHMRVSEVKPGMKGYGLSVFHGTKIERFEVEVVSVLKNFNPRHDVVLIRCSGANLEHTGAIAGMSGSPVYLTDEQGRDRLIGAFAYGWALLKDPLAGVQPIEYMLVLPHPQSKPVATPRPARGIRRAPVGADARPQSQGTMQWSLDEVLALPGSNITDSSPVKDLTNLQLNPAYFAISQDAARLQPLASPLMVAGVPGNVLENYAPLFRAAGLVPLQAGGSAGSGTAEPDSKALATRLEPGSVLAVPLVTGDLDLTAIGTVTETVGERVFGFGHPFSNEGPILLPMGTGQVNGILARLDQSMKLGSLIKITGALTADQTVGVAGALGDSPRTAQLQFRIVYADGSQDMTYRYDCAIHPRLTPILSAVALGTALSGMRDLPQYHTLDYDLKVEFANGQIVEMRDVAVNPRAWPIRSVVLPLMAASENPFERITLTRMSGTVTVSPEARSATILSVHIPRLKYKPGETIKAYLTYRPFRAPEAILPIELKLPHDLADGSYQLVVGGWDRFFADERMAKPFRFTAESADDVFDVLRDVMSLRHDALYIRLVRQPDGVAVGRVAMPRLPSSRRHILLGAGRSNITPFVSSTVKTIPTDFVMEGEAEFSIEVDGQDHVEVPSREKPGAEKPERQPAQETPELDAPEKHSTPASDE